MEKYLLDPKTSALGLAAALLCTALLAVAEPRFGFTPFPYDMTSEAVDRTYSIVLENSTLYALHLDDGIPWDEMVEDRPIPTKIQDEWDAWREHIPPGMPVYLGLAPLAKDRKHLAAAKGNRGGASMPRTLRGVRLDDDKVKRAYLTYARRAVMQFKPTWINLGIEAGELAAREPEQWPQFEALFNHVASALRREFPDLKIGISFGLQSLRKPAVAQRARALIEASDYLGLSFYPHMSPFGEKFGDPPLRPGEDAWREAYAWVRTYTDKPIAICETGYSTRDVSLRSFDLHLKGDAQMQARYVRELIDTARRDHYLFVVWFLAIDYDKLHDRMGSGNEVNLLWRNIGLLNGDLQPKPAWQEWKRALTPATGKAAALRPSAPPVAARPAAPRATTRIGFERSDDLFRCGPAGSSQLSSERSPAGGDSMLWKFKYRRGDWMWCMRALGRTLPSDTGSLRLWIRSDHDGPLFLQLEESDGEAFFTEISPGRDWAQVTIDLKSLRPDPKKRKDGVLQAQRLTKLLLADAGARSGASGSRRIWISDWVFTD